MLFSNLPLYHFDPQQITWHQQSNDQQQQQLLIHSHESETNSQFQTPPPPTNHEGGGAAAGCGLTSSIKPNSMVDRARQAQIPLPEPGMKCPRCESTNTKFCYFNNYSLSQPRHFCKTCRRYWTRGGALRNVPVGGGSRRTTKRSKGRSSSSNNNSNGSSRSPMITSSSTNSGASSCATSLFLTPNNLSQLPFLPSSLHHLGKSNPSGIGLSLLGVGGAEMEFPLMGNNFEGLGRLNGMQHMMHPYENSMANHHSFHSKPLDPEVLDRVASVKLEDSRGLNFTKDFQVVQAREQHQYNWNNNNVWANSEFSGFTSPSSTSHLLG